MYKKETKNNEPEPEQETTLVDSSPKKEEGAPRNFLKKIIIQSLLGAFRNYVLLIGSRGAYDLVLNLISSMKRGSFKRIDLKESLLGKETRNMAFVAAGFTFTWKSLSKLLSRTNTLNKSTSHFLIGSLAGLFILFENKKFRTQYWQALLFRSLQSGALTLHQKAGVSLPYGTQIFFALVATQVLYSFVLFADTLPSSETNLMNRMSRIPRIVFEINQQLIKGKRMSADEYIQKIPNEILNRTAIEKISAIGEISTLVPCRSLHLSCDSCTEAICDKFISCFKLMLPAYAFVNFTSKLVFGVSKLSKNPASETFKVIQKTLRSGIFIATFVGAYQFFICRIHNLTRVFKKPSHIHFLYAMAPFLSSVVSMFIESPQRLQTLNIFLAPKALSSFYNIVHSHGKLPKIPNFEAGLFSFSTGLMMMCYKNDPKTLDPFVSKFINHFIDSDINIDRIMQLLG